MQTKTMYFKIYFCLMGLLLLTVVTSYMHLGVGGVFVNVGIAVIKASLIILFFMHVRYSPPKIAIFAMAGFAWLVILLSFIFADYLTRGLVPLL